MSFAKGKGTRRWRRREGDVKELRFVKYTYQLPQATWSLCRRTWTKRKASENKEVLWDLFWWGWSYLYSEKRKRLQLSQQATLPLLLHEVLLGLCKPLNGKCPRHLSPSCPVPSPSLPANSISSGFPVFHRKRDMGARDGWVRLEFRSAWESGQCSELEVSKADILVRPTSDFSMHAHLCFHILFHLFQIQTSTGAPCNHFRRELLQGDQSWGRS